MSKPQGVEQRYYDHFLQGGWGKEDQSRYDNYMKATKGLDKELAWKALDGGQQFDQNGGDMQRYNALVKERDSKAAADAKAKRDEEARAAAKAKSQAVKAEPKPAPKPAIQQKTTVSKVQQQQVTQNNDINTKVNGNNNTVENTQDNSVRQTGGDNRTMSVNKNSTPQQQQMGKYTREQYLDYANNAVRHDSTDKGFIKRYYEKEVNKDKFKTLEDYAKHHYDTNNFRTRGDGDGKMGYDMDIRAKNNNPAHSQAKQKAQAVKQTAEIKKEQKQNVTQDNDINTNITGDNNKVFNEQDNSIRQYGGDNRTLVINDNGKGSKGYYNSADEAITMGTLGGFYDVDDSPAAQAKFVDQQQTMNRDAQKKYSNVGITTANKYSGFRGGNIDIKALQKRIDGNEQYFRDRATIQEVKTYGDRAAKFEYKPFEFGDPIKEVKSNADKIAKGYKDDIDDL